MTTTTPTAPTPSPAAAPRFRITWRDRWSNLLTVGLTAVALLAGLLVRDSALSRTQSYSDPSGVTFSYPQGWRVNASEAEAGVLRIRENSPAGFPTTFELRWMPVDPAAADGDALSTAANTLAMNRGRDYAAFQLFDIVTGLTVKALPGATATYVFVDAGGNAFQEQMPSVVLGEDSLARQNGRVYIFSLLATEGNRADDLPAYRAFVESAKLP
jgi:hypothetical protein